MKHFFFCFKDFFFKANKFSKKNFSFLDFSTKTHTTKIKICLIQKERKKIQERILICFVKRTFCVFKEGKKKNIFFFVSLKNKSYVKYTHEKINLKEEAKKKNFFFRICEVVYSRVHFLNSMDKKHGNFQDQDFLCNYYSKCAVAVILEILSDE